MCNQYFIIKLWSGFHCCAERISRWIMKCENNFERKRFLSTFIRVQGLLLAILCGQQEKTPLQMGRLLRFCSLRINCGHTQSLYPPLPTHVQIPFRPFPGCCAPFGQPDSTFAANGQQVPLLCFWNHYNCQRELRAGRDWLVEIPPGVALRQGLRQ